MVPVLPNVFIALNPTGATAGAEITSQVFDMAGFDYAIAIIEATVQDTASDVPTVLTLQTADSTNSTSFANDTSYGTASDVALANGPTSTGNSPYQLWGVNWKSRPRYGQFVITPRTTQTYSIRVLRLRQEQVGITASSLNATQVQTDNFASAIE